MVGGIQAFSVASRFSILFSRSLILSCACCNSSKVKDGALDDFLRVFGRPNIRSISRWMTLCVISKHLFRNVNTRILSATSFWWLTMFSMNCSLDLIEETYLNRARESVGSDVQDESLTWWFVRSLVSNDFARSLRTRHCPRHRSLTREWTASVDQDCSTSEPRWASGKKRWQREVMWLKTCSFAIWNLSRTDWASPERFRVISLAQISLVNRPETEIDSFHEIQSEVPTWNAFSHRIWLRWNRFDSSRGSVHCWRRKDRGKAISLGYSEEKTHGMTFVE